MIQAPECPLGIRQCRKKIEACCDGLTRGRPNFGAKARRGGARQVCTGTFSTAEHFLHLIARRAYVLRSKHYLADTSSDRRTYESIKLCSATNHESEDGV